MGLDRVVILLINSSDMSAAVAAGTRAGPPTGIATLCMGATVGVSTAITTAQEGSAQKHFYFDLLKTEKVSGCIFNWSIGIHEGSEVKTKLKEHTFVLLQFADQWLIAQT